MDNAITACDLVKTYPGGVRALDGARSRSRPATIFGLLGPNGAGKSTAVKILTTLSRPDDGEAASPGSTFCVSPTASAARSASSRSARRRPRGDGRENLGPPGPDPRAERARARPRVGGLLERFGLADAAERSSARYSGGMQRRLDVAMGLVHRPRVLFLDEPTTGLDPEIRATCGPRSSAWPARRG